MRWVCFVAVSLVVVGCSSSTPATTPTSLPTTSTTTLATTTTVDRITEIEAIYQDLEERRLEALYRGDREAFRAVHVDNGYLELSMDLFDVLDFDGPPELQVEILRLVHDGEKCVAFEDIVHRADLDESSDPSVTVLELRNGLWLLSYSGSGWTCDGPHPFES